MYPIQTCHWRHLYHLLTDNLLPDVVSVGLVVPQVIRQELLIVEGALADGQERVDDGVQDLAIPWVRHSKPVREKEVVF